MDKSSIHPGAVATDNILAHYGILGMKWGVRRTSAQLDADSDDAVRAKTSRATAKANRSTDPLSNQDLQHLVNRMNLDQQYARLSAPTKSRGRKFVESLILSPKKRDKTFRQIEPLTSPIRAAFELGQDIKKVKLI